jgi:hypothetical protein
LFATANVLAGVLAIFFPFWIPMFIGIDMRFGAWHYLPEEVHGQLQPELAAPDVPPAPAPVTAAAPVAPTPVTPAPVPPVPPAPPPPVSPAPTSAPAKFCTSCGKQLAESVAFCTECGAGQ